MPFADTMDALEASGKGGGGDPLLWEPEPENVLRRPFWMLRLLRTTINTGGYLTPRLHVPKLVWEQDGAK